MIRIALILIFFGTALWVNASEDVRIEFENKVQLKENSDITLGDLLRFQGVSDEYMAILRAVSLGKAPLLGTSQEFSNHFLSGVLRKALAKIPSTERKDWTIRIPESVKIETVGFQINSAQVESRLRDHWTSLCADCKFTLTNLSVPAVPKGLQGAPWEIKLGQALPRGQFSFPLEIKPEGAKSQLLWVQGQVQVQKVVPVTTRALNFGERLSEGDFNFTWKDVTFSYDTSPAKDELIGRRVNRSMQAGEILVSGRLEKEKALKRGERVRVFFEAEGWSVSLTGIAEEDGFVGDKVRVRNEKSKKQISGTVTKQGEVVLR
ncbi:MAG: flagellar basal body P-ring formation protein FlgA [Bdellovibrionales bacterium]|nr:flagellar basal body P-ring formation protein FlgA [Bdellovibrionales bacterium]